MTSVTILPDGVAAVTKAAQDGLTALCDWITDEARRTAPVGTAAEGDRTPGEFRDSIHTIVADGEVSVVADAPYALFVEVGTVHTPAHGTVTNAMTAGLSHVDELVGGKMAEELR